MAVNVTLLLSGCHCSGGALQLCPDNPRRHGPQRRHLPGRQRGGLQHLQDQAGRGEVELQ